MINYCFVFLFDLYLLSNNKTIMKGQWIICVQSYNLENGTEIPKGRMEYSYARFPVSGLWRIATEEEIQTKDWHKGNYFNLKNV